ncbi:MAG: chemotaxis-specific protein-glutamate methyltransferase CheB [Deltaproteobacteria bacterium]|nr:chemotaxis-specific protein-glutamate methyltransferase CheB [Deltaproteobacteria bacterium]
MKWLIVDDTALYRKILQNVLASFKDVSEIQTAPNGSVAIKKAIASSPDVVTLDYEMPDMNGLEVMQRMQTIGLKSEYIMISAHTPEGAQIAIQAMEKGAIDAIAKPDGMNIESNIESLKTQLIPILAAVRTRLAATGSIAAQEFSEAKQISNFKKIRSVAVQGQAPKIIAIGASTGGPRALTTVLTQLPEKLPIPVVVTIHMPKAFTGQLADSLDKKCALQVVEAKNGMPLRPGVIHIAPGGMHMRVVPASVIGTHKIELTYDEPEHNCRPSVDYLFRSIAREFKAAAIGVILTGMGHDGASGMKLMKLQGATTIAQNKETCVVFGMPAKAIEEGSVDHIMPIETLHTAILKAVNPS